jgi:hypothetical protein
LLYWSRLFFLLLFLLNLTLGLSPAFAQEEKTQGPVATTDTTVAAEAAVVSKESLPARTVYLAVEKVQAADRYQVQVLPVDQQWANEYRTEFKTEQIRMRLTPGHYRLRVRSVDKRNRPGRWGEFQSFWVNFKPPDKVFPQPNQELEAKGSNNEKITFEWPSVYGAKFYVFKLRDEFGNLKKNVRTDQTFLTQEISVDSKYTWSLTPIIDMNSPDPEHQTWMGFSLLAKRSSVRSVVLNVDPIRKAISYQFEFVKFLNDDKTSEPSLFESTDPGFRARLSAGAYEMRVRAVYKSGVTTDWSNPQKFFVEMPIPKIIEPRSNAQIDPTDDEKAKVRLRWEKIETAFKYGVEIYNQDDSSLVQRLESDTEELDVFLAHNARYLWKVRAYNKFEKPRNPAGVDSKNDTPGEGFGISTYIPLKLSSGEEPSQKYAWTRYIVSNEQLLTRNYDNNNKVQQTVLGGSGEVAYGNWWRKTGYGMLGTLAYSGFRNSSQNYTYAMGSVMLGRRYLLADEYRLRLWGGLGYKELPEVTIDPTRGNAVAGEKIASFGPELKFSIIKELSSNIGGYLNGGIYYSALSVKTPNELAQLPQFSYHLGLSGTLRLTDSIVGTLGYTYQVEKAAYRARSVSSENNSVQISGNFLSLSLQFGLEKTEK